MAQNPSQVQTSDSKARGEYEAACVSFCIEQLKQNQAKYARLDADARQNGNVATPFTMALAKEDLEDLAARLPNPWTVG